MKLAFSRPDDGVSIVIAAPKKTLERALGKMTQEVYEAHVLERSIPKDAVEVVRLTDDWVAPDRAHRAAWRLRGGKVVIEQSKAVT